MKTYRASFAGCLVCFLAGTVALAQSDAGRDGAAKPDAPDQSSKPADEGTAKPVDKAKTPAKDSKSKSTKSTSKKSGLGNLDAEPSDPTVMSSDSTTFTPNGTKNAKGAGAANRKPVEPNWMVGQVHLTTYATTKFAADEVNIEPTKGQVLVQATFELQAVHPDPKAAERYARLTNSTDKRGVARFLSPGARVLESKNIALRASNGTQYMALWILDEQVRTTIVHAEVAPNRYSAQSRSKGGVRQAGPWFDAEQSFITRVSTLPNRPPVTDYATSFAGVLRTDQPFPMTFLFSIPESIDLQLLTLVIDSEVFALE